MARPTAVNTRLCLLATLLSCLAHAAAHAAPEKGAAPLEIGRLEVAVTVAPGPRLFFSSEEVGRAQASTAADARAKSIYDRFIGQADGDIELRIEPVDETWWETAKDKPWEQTYPEVFENTWLKPAKFAKAAATLATAYLLSNETKYADAALAMLTNLASFSFSMEHYDVGMNYSVWGIDALKAYDVLQSRMSAENRRAVDGMMTRLAGAVAKNDAYWIENNIGGGVNNHLAWHKTMLGLLGLFYGRQDMIDHCMNGRRGLVSLLEDGLLDDGLWCESSLNYQFAAIAPMLVLADCQKRMNCRPGLHSLTAADGRRLKQSFDAMINVLAPDCMIPPIGDAYGYHQKLWRIPCYEQCWAIWGDGSYAWLINRNPEPTVGLLFAPPVPAAAPPPIRSILLPEHGYAILRSHRDEEYWGTDAWMAFLTYDRSGVHANADKLSLMLFGCKRMLLSDVEGRTTTQAHAFSSRIQRELNRGGLSQNTVMIDGRDQRCMPKMLRLVEFRDLPDEKRVSAADVENIVYDNVRQMRTVAMTPDYVLDVFQVDCGGQERQIDWIAHAMSEKASPTPETQEVLGQAEPFALPQAGPWTWLRDAKSFQPTGMIRLGCREENVTLRLCMWDPGAERVILCGYPATDDPASGDIPMAIVRRRGNSAVFAAVWLIGDGVKSVELERQPDREGRLLFTVKADGRARQHLVPLLSALE